MNNHSTRRSRYSIEEHVRPTPAAERVASDGGYAIHRLVANVEPSAAPVEPQNGEEKLSMSHSENYYGERAGADPNDLWALNNLALIALRNGESMAAMQHLEQALRIHAQITSALHNTLLLSLMQSSRSVEGVEREAMQVQQTLVSLARRLPSMKPPPDEPGA